MMDFENREVIVTGGTGGLGTAVVGALLERGAFCHIPFRGEAGAQHFPYRDHARVKLVANVELTEEADIARLYGGVKKLWASLHIAGGFAAGAVAETEKDAFAAQLEMNLMSCFLCSRAAIRAMTSDEGGRIVNVAARPALEPRHGAGMAAYAASKAAVAAFTQALAQEVVEKNILVNAVAPGTLDTPANRRDMPKANFSHWAALDQVAATILFLASHGNGVTRGAIVPVYGKS